ncbi:MAG: Clp protease ClpP [Synergistaceae bacterium]|nr:Clp protease ClpP [Synergistaceae bacterium]
MYKITNENGRAELLLYSLIEGGTTAGNILKQLRNVEGEITLRINSDGGEAFDAIALYNYLKPKGIDVVVDGICASAASIVAMAGEHITMMQGSMMMIHNPCSLVYGDSETHKGESDVLNKLRDQMADIYAERTGMTRDTIITLMDAETWMTAQEAVNTGFADAVESVITVTPLVGPLPVDEEIEFTDRYAEGVKAERERLRALDELMTPERSAVINAAKYETGQTAQDIALTLLKSDRGRTSSINSLPLEAKADPAVHVSEILKRLRG